MLDRSDSTGGSITRDSHGQSYATPSAMTISFDRASPLAMPTQQRRLSLPDRPNPMEMQNNPIVRAFLEAEDALPRTTVRMPSSTVRRPKAKKKRILYKAASTKAGTPSRASQPIAGDSGDEGTWIFVHDPPMPVPAIGRPAVVPMGAFVQPVQSSGQQFIAAPSQFVPTQTAQLPQYVSVGLQAPNRITYC